MLHFIAFDQSDDISLAQLKAALGEKDVLVFCEKGCNWPNQHPLKNKHAHITLSEEEESIQLGKWLAQHNALYWGA